MEENLLKISSQLKNGEYCILKVLGQGGFGVTYEAEQTSLGRKVAIKEFFMKEYCNREEVTSHVSVPSSGSRELVERYRQKFIREARMIAGLNHGHIVKIHDVFEENGTAYYVMEYLGGGCLGDGVKAGKAMSEAEALNSIRQIADALSYLHKKGIIHFDVKPSNMLKDEDDHLKLIDFGISKHYDEAGQQTSSTPVGISKGYAPLEQYQQGSDIKSFTPATDIYSLGATLYALLSGSNPPEASVIYEDGLPVIDGVSSSVMRAIEKAMQPRRKDRPQSVEEFLKLLGSPVTDDDEDTVVPGSKPASVLKPEPDPKPSSVSNPTPEPVRKGFPKWLYGLFVGIAVAILAVVLIIRPDSSSATDDPQTDSTGTHAGHDWVDLGLSVKWATCNVGASSPEGYGNYFAWGETSPKSEYTWATLKYCNDDTGDSFSEYNQNQGGTRDNRTVLEPSDDAARANWGGSWRMPTTSEFQELIDNCTWTWTTINGKNGYKVTSKSNGNSIFLPAAGYRDDTSLYGAGIYGYYWSSSIDESYSYYALILYFSSGGHSTSNNGRRFGQSVRPVFR